MKKMFVLLTLVSLVMICSCQKQDSTVEAQLAQRKARLDSREQALDEREKALERREQAVAASEKAVPAGRIIPSQRQAADPTQAKAEREKRMQQFPPELRALISDRSPVDSASLAKDPGAAHQGQSPDPAQAETERQKRIQQLPPELQGLIPDRSGLEAIKAQKERAIQQGAVQSQRSLEGSQNNMSGSTDPAVEGNKTTSSAPSPMP